MQPANTTSRYALTQAEIRVPPTKCSEHRAWMSCPECEGIRKKWTPEEWDSMPDNIQGQIEKNDKVAVISVIAEGPHAFLNWAMNKPKNARVSQEPFMEYMQDRLPYLISCYPIDPGPGGRFLDCETDRVQWCWDFCPGWLDTYCEYEPQHWWTFEDFEPPTYREIVQFLVELFPQPDIIFGRYGNGED